MGIEDYIQRIEPEGQPAIRRRAVKLSDADFIPDSPWTPVLREPKPLRITVAGPPIPCPSCGVDLELNKRASTVIGGGGMVMVRCPSCHKPMAIGKFEFICTAEFVQ